MKEYKYIPPVIHGTLKRTYASQLAMVSGRGGEIWHMENHLALRSSLERIEKGELHLDFFSPDIEGGLPFLQTEICNLSGLSPEAVLNQIHQMLEAGFVSLKVDEYEVKGLTKYRKSHFIHRLLLCDRTSNGLFATTYQARSFRPVIVNDADLLRGLTQEELATVRMHTIKPYCPNLNIRRIQRILEDYLISADLSESLEFYFSDCNETEMLHYKNQALQETYIYGKNVYAQLYKQLATAKQTQAFDLAAMTRMLLDHSKMLQAITNNRDIPLQSEVIRQADALVGDIQLMHMKTLYQLQKSERHSTLLQLQHFLMDFSTKENRLIENMLANLSTFQQ